MQIVNGTADNAAYQVVTIPMCNSVTVRNPDPNTAHGSLSVSFDGTNKITVLPGNGQLSECKLHVMGATTLQIKASENTTPYELICDMGNR